MKYYLRFICFKTLFSLALSLTLATIASKLSFGYSALSSISISYKLFSYISTITSLLGSYLTICLHSSEPIEPPPPVTNTVLFLLMNLCFVI